MHLVTGDVDHKLVDVLFEVYLQNGADTFRIHQEEYTIYIHLYTYFLDRYKARHGELEKAHGDFMRRFLKDGVPAYQDFLDEVVGLLDMFHLSYECVDMSKTRKLHLPKGGFGCVNG